MLLFLRSKQTLLFGLVLVLFSGLVFLFFLSQVDEELQGGVTPEVNEVSEFNQKTETIELPVPDTVQEWLVQDGMVPTPISEETESEIIELPAPDMPKETDTQNEQESE
jgi:hypothetical protein